MALACATALDHPAHGGRGHPPSAPLPQGRPFCRGAPGAVPFVPRFFLGSALNSAVYFGPCRWLGSAFLGSALVLGSALWATPFGQSFLFLFLGRAFTDSVPEAGPSGSAVRRPPCPLCEPHHGGAPAGHPRHRRPGTRGVAVVEAADRGGGSALCCWGGGGGFPSRLLSHCSRIFSSIGPHLIIPLGMKGSGNGVGR